MLVDVDYFFVYRHLLRFILVHKTNTLGNSFQLPCLKSLVVFIRLQNVIYLEDSYFFNYMYLFRFFYGNRSFFSRYKAFFSLGYTYHSFTIQSFFFKRFVFFPLLFLINDVLSITSSHNYHYFFYSPGVFFFTVFWYEFIFRKEN